MLLNIGKTRIGDVSACEVEKLQNLACDKKNEFLGKFVTCAVFFKEYLRISMSVKTEKFPRKILLRSVSQNTIIEKILPNIEEQGPESSV